MALLAAEADVHDEVYWTGLFSTGRTGAPLLVGSYDQVAAYVERYLASASPNCCSPKWTRMTSSTMPARCWPGWACPWARSVLPGRNCLEGI